MRKQEGGRRKKEEGRRNKEEGRRKKEEGRRKKEEGRRKKEEGRRRKEEGKEGKEGRGGQESRGALPARGSQESRGALLYYLPAGGHATNARICYETDKAKTLLSCREACVARCRDGSAVDSNGRFHESVCFQSWRPLSLWHVTR